MDLIPTPASETILRTSNAMNVGLDSEVYNRLLRERIIFLGSVVEDAMANAIAAQILLLSAEDPEKDIYLYINSPGGSISAGMAIYDTMQYIDCPVATYCMGMAASGAAILLAAGSKGKRFALPHAKVMIHQPWSSGIGGQASDVEIEMREILKMKRLLNEILAKHTGKPLEEIEAETERNRYFNATEAKEFGLIDEVLENRPVPTVAAAAS